MNGPHCWKKMYFVAPLPQFHSTGRQQKAFQNDRFFFPYVRSHGCIFYLLLLSDGLNPDICEHCIVK